MDHQTIYKDICLPKVLYENYIEDKLEQDLVIPDYHCSAQKIVHCEANAVVINKSFVDGKVILEGMCYWKILYLSEEDSSLHHINCEKSFTEIFSVSSTEGNVRYKIKTKNVHCKLHSASRAECKAIICVAVKIEGSEGRKVLVGSGDPKIQLDQINVMHYELGSNCEKEFHIVAELRPKIKYEYEIYKIMSDIVLKECKCADGRATIRGICKNRVILLSKEGYDADSIELETGFTQSIEIEGITERWKPCVECTVNESDVSLANEDGEEYWLINNSVSVDIAMYCPKEITIINDAFHLENEIECQRKTMEFYRDIQSFETVTHLSQKAHMNTSDMSVLFFNTSAEVEKIDVQDGVMIIDGKLSVGCANALKDGVFYNVFAFPFQTTKQLDVDFSRLKCDAEATVNNFGFIIINDNELEINCDCSIALTMYSLDLCEGIVDVSVGEPKNEILLKTPLVLYYGNQNERLWDICKKYSVPVNAVMQNNDLEDKTLSKDQLIFISKH